MGIFSIFGFQNHLEPVIILTSNNSRTSNNFYMKLGPVTKVDKWNTAMSKKIDDNAITISLIVTFYLRKTENRAKNI